MEPRIEGFEVLAPLGSGAMSTVWRARDRATGQIVALKVLHPHVALSPGSLERFLHEVRAYERLRHPNVISCLRGGSSDGTWYVALEHLEGGDLRGILRAVGRLPPEAAAFVLNEVLAALAHAHHAGLVHRDVKPENVMVASDGTLKLADFGISTAIDFTRLTEAGRIVGTPAYMAPEQAHTGQADARSDLWSAGVLLHEMVTGVNPFASEHASTTVARLQSLTPPPLGYGTPDVPEALEDLCSRLLSRDPAARPASAEAAAALLAPVLETGGRLATRAGFKTLADDPVAVCRRASEERAAARLRAARALLAASPPHPAAAFVEASEALALDPGSEEAERLLVELGPRVGARRSAGPSPRALELEREAEESPSNVLALVNLVRLARGEGDLLHAARAYRWGRRRSPRDRFAAVQLATALGFDLAAHVEGTDEALLRGRLQGRGVRGAAATAGDLGWSLLLSRPVWVAVAVLALVVAWTRWTTVASETPRAGLQTPHSGRRPAPGAVRAADPGGAYLEKAQAVENAGDLERAVAIYQRFLKERPGDRRAPEALFREARALEEMRRVPEAVAAYESLIQRFPAADTVLASRRRAAALLEGAGEIERALVVLEPASGFGDFEDQTATALARARLLERRGDPGAAAAIYDDVLLRTPLPPWLSARAKLGRGRLLAARKDQDAARWLGEAAEEAGEGSAVAREAREIQKAMEAAASPPVPPSPASPSPTP